MPGFILVPDENGRLVRLDVAEDEQYSDSDDVVQHFSINQLHELLVDSSIPISKHTLTSTNHLVIHCLQQVVDHLKTKPGGPVRLEVHGRSPPRKRRRRGRPTKADAKWNQPRKKTKKNFNLTSVVRSCCKMADCCVPNLKTNILAAKILDEVVMARLLIHSMTGKLLCCYVCIINATILIMHVHRSSGSGGSTWYNWMKSIQIYWQEAIVIASVRSLCRRIST